MRSELFFPFPPLNSLPEQQLTYWPLADWVPASEQGPQVKL